MAPSLVAVVVFAFLSALTRSDAQSTTSRITINPSSLSLNGSTPEARVEVECRPPAGASPSLVSNMNILRVKDGSSTEQPLAGARSVGGDDSAKVDPGANIPGSSAEGSLGEGVIKFIMTRAGCNDAGMYICRVNYYASNTAVTPTLATSTANLTAVVLPGQLSLSIDPDLPTYTMDTTVALTCSGSVGTVNTENTVEWVWEHRKDGPWMSYNGRVDTSNATSHPAGCYSTQNSSITFNASADDQGRQYRCYVRHNGESFDNFAGVLPPLSVNSSDGSTVTPGSTFMTSSPSNTSGTGHGSRVAMGTTSKVMEVVVTVLAVSLASVW